MHLLTFAYAMPLLTKLAYKPVGIVLGVVGGRMAGKAYAQVWSAVAHEDHSPGVMEKEGGWGEVVSAAVIRAAVFAGVKAFVDRTGATAYENLTGTWPGSHSKADGQKTAGRS